jgi:hypothetical protein
MAALGLYTTNTTTNAGWAGNYVANVSYGGAGSGSYATFNPEPPRPKSNLARLHDRVEATCAKARLAA